MPVISLPRPPNSHETFTESGYISRILYLAGRPFIWDACCQAPRASYPATRASSPLAHTQGPVKLGRTSAEVQSDSAACAALSVISQRQWCVARCPIWTCSGRGLASRRVTTTLVRSCRTFSPLPALAGGSPRLLTTSPMPRSCIESGGFRHRGTMLPAVCFLCHCP